MFETLKAKIQMSKLMTKAMYSKFERDTKGETPVKALFMLLILAVLAGAVVPTAVQSVKAGNTTGFTASELAVYGLITIIILIAVILLFARIAMGE